jgi:hypothetical protein
MNPIAATEGREPIKILKQNQVNMQNVVRGPGIIDD